MSKSRETGVDVHAALSLTRAKAVGEEEKKGSEGGAAERGKGKFLECRAVKKCSLVQRSTAQYSARRRKIVCVTESRELANGSVGHYHHPPHHTTRTVWCESRREPRSVLPLRSARRSSARCVNTTASPARSPSATRSGRAEPRRTPVSPTRSRTRSSFSTRSRSVVA